MATAAYPYQQASFAHDWRHANPLIEAFLYVPPPPETIITPELKNKRRHRRHHRKMADADNDSLSSQGSFASTISLIKRKFFRRAKH